MVAGSEVCRHNTTHASNPAPETGRLMLARQQVMVRDRAWTTTDVVRSIGVATRVAPSCPGSSTASAAPRARLSHG